ncbi:MAG: UbiX family flavin prenyltransferase [Pirellulales bacterium]|nr:UbiX family flavin prenyltransferase [Pirellulales bacterium]
MRQNIVVAVTGASGVVYAKRLIEVLISVGCDIQLSVSRNALAVLKQELDLTLGLDRIDAAMLKVDIESTRDDDKLKRLRAMAGISTESDSVLSMAAGEPGKIHYHDCRNLRAPLASGSFLTDGMVVCPCSGSTLAAIAHGTNVNLIHRAAEVHLKEGRRLILVPRETPLSAVHLENMQRAAAAGAVVLPAAPGFYNRPKSISELVDFIVARICDRLGIKNNLLDRWGA